MVSLYVWFDCLKRGRSLIRGSGSIVGDADQIDDRSDQFVVFSLLLLLLLLIDPLLLLLLSLLLLLLFRCCWSDHRLIDRQLTDRRCFANDETRCRCWSNSFHCCCYNHQRRPIEILGSIADSADAPTIATDHSTAVVAAIANSELCEIFDGADRSLMPRLISSLLSVPAKQKE